MIRQIIHIDQEKCNGCGLCVKACHEGAIALIGGKAYLAREHYCDGLGDCLPGCPTGAITFETREAPAYDEAAVLKAKAEKAAAQGGCPGSRMRTLSPEPEMPQGGHCPSQLRQWPVQLKLVPVQAPGLTGRMYWWRRTALPMPMGTSTGIFSGERSCSSPAPSWTAWTTARS